jgi:hypothetical protein
VLNIASVASNEDAANGQSYCGNAHVLCATTKTGSDWNSTAFRRNPCKIEEFGYEPLGHSLPEVLDILLASDESGNGYTDFPRSYSPVVAEKAA